MIYLILILFLFSLVSKTLRAFTRHGGRAAVQTSSAPENTGKKQALTTEI